jgi:hypothetical protein
LKRRWLIQHLLDAQFLIDAGIMDLLCEHAHSLHPGLRLNAIWALKHLTYEADNELKKRCIEQLGSGWLDQLITVDAEDDALFNRMRKRHGLAGDDEDEDMDGVGYEEGKEYEEEDKAWTWPALSRLSPNGLGPVSHDLPARMHQAERRLGALHNAELNPIRKARHDDLAIQEQALNFIRNIITFSGGETAMSSKPMDDMTDMVDYMFSQLGQDRFFEILTSKLRFKVLHPFSRRNSGGNDARVVYPQARLIEAVIMILVHMAAGAPRHRQLVISQTDLLKQLGNHVDNRDADVRRALVHLFKNLTDTDAGALDAADVEQRALELQRLGFLSKLESLAGDRELDVSERVKETLYQIKNPYQ